MSNLDASINDDQETRRRNELHYIVLLEGTDDANTNRRWLNGGCTTLLSVHGGNDLTEKIGHQKIT